jgi:beta-xylosidase
MRWCHYKITYFQKVKECDRMRGMNPAASIDAVNWIQISNTVIINRMCDIYQNKPLSRWHGVPAASICAAG